MELQDTTAREYLRVSYDRSGRSKSTDEQHAENLDHAQRMGVTLGAAYDDVSVSASRFTSKVRRGFDQLMADLESGAFGAQVLWLWESSRGSRRVGEWVLMCDLLAEQQIQVYVTTHSRLYDPSNPRDRRTLLEDAVDSEYESGKLSQRIRRDTAAAAKAGRPPARNAFGHPRNDVVDGYRVPVPQEQLDREREAVRRLYSGFLAGKTLVTLGRELDEAGHRTAQGNAFGRSGARAVLRNPRNAGIRYYKGERVADGQWKPIVSEETWQAAVHLLDDPARRKNHGTARRWIGGNLYLCGTCGGDMRVNYHDDVRVYRCRATGHNTRRAEQIDVYVREAIAHRLRSEDVTSLLGPDTGQEVGRLHADATALRQRLDGLGADYADGTLTKSQMRAASERLETRLAEIDERLAEIGRRSQLAELLAGDDPAQEFLDADVDVQRATIDALCTVTVLPNPRRRWSSISETVQIEPRSPE